MSIEEMLLGFTINGAKQLGIEDKKGSITAGKDADYLVFDKDLLTTEKEGFSYNKQSLDNFFNLGLQFRDPLGRQIYLFAKLQFNVKKMTEVGVVVNCNTKCLIARHNAYMSIYLCKTNPK